MLDIRLRDLQFEKAATGALIEAFTDSSIKDDTWTKLRELTVGWLAGLRMLLLAGTGRPDVQEFQRSFEGKLW